MPSTSNLTSLKKINLNPDPLISNNLLWLSLKIYYNETELTNLDESTLKLYYYNETQAEWQVLDSILNTNENYLLINLTHLSVYGVFGQEAQQETPADSNSGSSGGSGGTGSVGGGSSRRGSTTMIPETETKPAETKQETPETKTAQTGSPAQEKINIPLEISTGQVTKMPDKILKFSKKNFGILIALFLIVITYIIVRIEKNIKRKRQIKVI